MIIQEVQQQLIKLQNLHCSSEDESSGDETLDKVKLLNALDCTKIPIHDFYFITENLIIQQQRSIVFCVRIERIKKITFRSHFSSFEPVFRETLAGA